jgi:hypothetical protein
VAPQSSNVHDPEILKGKVLIRAPGVIKGPKNKRAKSVLEKKQGKKKTGKKKGSQICILFILFL